MAQHVASNTSRPQSPKRPLPKKTFHPNPAPDGQNHDIPIPRQTSPSLRLPAGPEVIPSQRHTTPLHDIVTPEVHDKSFVARRSRIEIPRTKDLIEKVILKSLARNFS
ncbi:hypothetical protein HYFRA_00008602 [Hymenoscyphus fraxineus]|uniref:Uncharacterized protein n=1 Tax=Hymenoscyphus fraxineus TaxID=746836 RepID=A0A9N9KW17_9HELO|nr:hypothetical protein HYFRA_00008602 [Hymenoscyphus fraxineus]